MKANGSPHPVLSRGPWLRALDSRIDGQVVTVTASMQGRVDRVLISDGQLVEKGELLVELEHGELDRKVEAAAAELDQALVESMAAQGGPEAAGRQILSVHSRLEFASSPQILRARGRYLHARLDRLNADVRAPVSGRVLARSVQLREYTALAQPLVSILDSDDLWVLARFGAQDFDRLRVGQAASIRAGLHLLAARVAGLVSAEEPALVEFVVRPLVPLRPGMTVATAVAAG